MEVVHFQGLDLVQFLGRRSALLRLSLYTLFWTWKALGAGCWVVVIELGVVAGSVEVLVAVV